MLPNAAAKFEEIKVRGYLLDVGHPQHGGKAASFRAFGFDVADWAAMRDALLRHPAANQATAAKASPTSSNTKSVAPSARRTAGILASPRC